jgi:hypothetical protein
VPIRFSGNIDAIADYLNDHTSAKAAIWRGMKVFYDVGDYVWIDGVFLREPMQIIDEPSPGIYQLECFKGVYSASQLTPAPAPVTQIVMENTAAASA